MFIPGHYPHTSPLILLCVRSISSAYNVCMSLIQDIQYLVIVAMLANYFQGKQFDQQQQLQQYQ